MLSNLKIFRLVLSPSLHNRILTAWLCAGAPGGCPTISGAGGTPGFPKRARGSPRPAGHQTRFRPLPLARPGDLYFFFYSKLFCKKNTFGMFKGEKDGKPFKRHLRPTASELCRGPGRRPAQPQGRQGRGARRGGDHPPAGNGTPPAPRRGGRPPGTSSRQGRPQPPPHRRRSSRGRPRQAPPAAHLPRAVPFPPPPPQARRRRRAGAAVASARRVPGARRCRRRSRKRPGTSSLAIT